MTGRRRAKSGQHGPELLARAPEVIAARLRLMAEGLADPLNADHTEMRLMASEKVEAMSASAAATHRHVHRIAGQMSEAASREASEAARTARAVLAAGDPLTVVSLQTAWMLGLWSRAAETGLALTRGMEAAGQDALKPFHRTTLANAKRLKRQAVRITPPEASTGQGVRRAPAHGPPTQAPSSGSNTAPCQPHRISDPSGVR